MFKIASVLLVLSPLFLLAPAADAQEGNAPPKLNELTCREMIKMTGAERDYTLIFYHGFISGQKNQTAIDDERLAAATDTVIETCIDTPDATLLSVFEKARD